jgi:cysteine desulfurase
MSDPLHRCDLTVLSVDSCGFVQPEKLLSAIRPNTVLFSCCHGNNEIGTIQDAKVGVKMPYLFLIHLQKLGEICKQHKILFHIDACQVPLCPGFSNYFRVLQKCLLKLER